MDFDKIRNDINSILEDGDKVKASAKILDLEDYIKEEEAKNIAAINDLNTKVSEQEKTIENLNKENDDIRAANFDVMLKYGTLVNQTQPVLKKVDNTNEEEKPTSWEDIMKME